MKKIIIILILFVILSVVGIYFAKSQNISIPDFSFHLGSGKSESFKPIFSSYSKEYRNSSFRFSLRMPEDFEVREIMSEESFSALIENKKGEGIQILIYPFDDIRVLTADMIRADLPDLKMADLQPVEVGYDYKGLAFKSDNPAFSGASREVWFVFRGNLYQISTYERFDDLLKSIFTTWRFE